VEAGETIEVTSHGRPVGRIVPIREESPYERLVREGRIRQATGDLLDFEPEDLPPGSPTLTELLMEQRADER
jgi:prevent-host-death family protein